MPKSRKRKSKRSPAPSSRIVKMNPRMKEILELQMERFRKKFGRDPGPGDPVFFDPDAAEPSPMRDITDDVLAALQNADMPPEFAYAYRKTGLLGLLADKSAWDPDDIDEWNAAVDEYRAIEKASKQPGRPKPETWSTEIPELLASPIKQVDLDQVIACISAVEPIEARGMTVVARIELAANFAASAMEHDGSEADVRARPRQRPLWANSGHSGRARRVSKWDGSCR